MEDYEILGINKTFDIKELKKAYRLKIKELHPDKNLNDINSHFKMIKINKAYENLQLLIDGERKNKINKTYKDLDYSIYKKGIEIFKNIHPSKWKKVSINSSDDISVISDPKTIKILENLIDEISKAYKCFTIIVNDYENSTWFNDSRLKMRELEKMSIRYLKIKNSYEIDRKKLGKLNN